MSKITASNIHEFKVGDVFTIAGVCEPDRRWWKRLLHFVLRRPPPVKEGVLRRYTVTKVAKTTFDTEAKQ